MTWGSSIVRNPEGYQRVPAQRQVKRAPTEGSAAYATPKAAEPSPSPLQKGRGVPQCRLSRGLGSKNQFPSTAGTMPRTVRVDYPGAICQVMDRRDRREAIFDGHVW
jgi:hypothetical protein